MARYLARRIAQMFVLFIVFLSLTFLILTALPGDAVAQRFLSNPNLPPEAAELAVRRLGLDKPLWEQYTGYLVNFFRGDFGFSFSQYPRPVSDIILERLPRTLVLFLVVIIAYYTLGFLAGKYLAWRRGRRGEHALTMAGVFLYTVFYPWFALMLIWFFAFYADVVPINKFLDPEEWVDAPFSSNHVFMVIFAFLAVAAVLALGVRMAARRIRDPRLARRIAPVGYPGPGDRSDLVLVRHRVRLDPASLRRRHRPPHGPAGDHHHADQLRRGDAPDPELHARDDERGLHPHGPRKGGFREADQGPARSPRRPPAGDDQPGAGGGDGDRRRDHHRDHLLVAGDGELLFTAVIEQDTPLAITAFSFVGVMAMVGHLLVDLLYAFLDPRIRVSAG